MKWYVVPEPGLELGVVLWSSPRRSPSTSPNPSQSRPKVALASMLAPLAYKMAKPVLESIWMQWKERSRRAKERSCSYMRVRRKGTPTHSSYITAIVLWLTGMARDEPLCNAAVSLDITPHRRAGRTTLALTNCGSGICVLGRQSCTASYSPPLL